MSVPPSTFIRFSLRQRIEHLSVMILFTILAVTGLPQKFYEYEISRWILVALGGIDTARWLHRAAGLAFAAFTVVHLVGALWSVVSRQTTFSMVPTRKDFSDAVLTLKYYLGLSEEQARFDRFDYRQKFEYWGLVLGAMVVIATGVVLLWPTVVTQWLPGQVVPAAKVAHSNEGLMAFLVVILWHVYNAHFNPDVFPFDKTIFTGKISRDRMIHEHPLEYERLTGEPASPESHGAGS